MIPQEKMNETFWIESFTFIDSAFFGKRINDTLLNNFWKKTSDFFDEHRWSGLFSFFLQPEKSREKGK